MVHECGLDEVPVKEHQIRYSFSRLGSCSSSPAQASVPEDHQTKITDCGTVWLTAQCFPARSEPVVSSFAEERTVPRERAAMLRHGKFVSGKQVWQEVTSLVRRARHVRAAI